MELFASAEAAFTLGVIGWWIWVLLAAELLLLVVFTEYENGFAATVSLVAFLAALQWWAKVDVFGYLWAHPLSLAAVAASYLLLGVGWSIFKWRSLVVGQLARHDELFAEYLADRKLPPETTELPVEHRPGWIRVIENTKTHETNYRSLAETPLARHHKARIIRWMTLWVFSMTLYFCKDMVSEFFGMVYKNLAFFFQKIADNIYGKRNLKSNLELPPAPPLPVVPPADAQGDHRQRWQ